MKNTNLEVETCVVRVESLGGHSHGTGFVIAPDPSAGSGQALAVTCVHVVEGCGAGPGGRVRLTFWAGGAAVEAEVLAGDWYPEADVAFLRVRGSLPEGVIPAILAPSAGLDGSPVRAFGYPNVGEVDGLWGTGELSGRVTQTGQPLLQLRSTQITAGFSGSPVWAYPQADIPSKAEWTGTGGRVIGMVTSVTVPDRLGRLGDVAFAIPVETLRDLCPVELELRPVEARSGSEVPSGGIRAGRIKARNVVSGVQLQGGVPPEATGLAELAQAIRRGGIEAEEIDADSVVDGLQSVTDPPPGTPDDDDKGER